MVMMTSGTRSQPVGLSCDELMVQCSRTPVTDDLSDRACLYPDKHILNRT